MFPVPRTNNIYAAANSYPALRLSLVEVTFSISP